MKTGFNRNEILLEIEEAESDISNYEDKILDKQEYIIKLKNELKEIEERQLETDIETCPDCGHKRSQTVLCQCHSDYQEQQIDFEETMRDTI